MLEHPVFKAQKIFFIKDVLIINVGLLILFAFRNDDPYVEGSVIGLINIANLFFFFLKRNVHQIFFGEECIEIQATKFFLSTKSTINYERIQFSYEDGWVARGSSDKVLRLYVDDKFFASLHPVFTGFSKAQISQIIEALEQHQVERVELDI